MAVSPLAAPIPSAPFARELRYVDRARVASILVHVLVRPLATTTMGGAPARGPRGARVSSRLGEVLWNEARRKARALAAQRRLPRARQPASATLPDVSAGPAASDEA